MGLRRWTIGTWLFAVFGAGVLPVHGLPNTDRVLDLLQEMYARPSDSGVEDYTMELRLETPFLFRDSGDELRMKYYWSSRAGHRLDFVRGSESTDGLPDLVPEFFAQVPLDFDLVELRRDYVFRIFQAGGLWTLRGRPIPHGPIPRAEEVSMTIDATGIHRILYRFRSWTALLSDLRWESTDGKKVLQSYYLTLRSSDRSLTYRVVIDRERLQGAWLPARLRFDPVAHLTTEMTLICENPKVNVGLGDRFFHPRSEPSS